MGKEDLPERGDDNFSGWRLIKGSDSIRHRPPTAYCSGLHNNLKSS